ncbi:MAG: YicC family protein [Bryobacterales bacterium]|nr:YicC family protein [Bryobacterales bacterium]
MTGFARTRRAVAQGEIVVSLKSVNHRALDLQFHMPGDLDAFEPALRKAVAEKVVRGHVDVRVHFARTGAAGAVSVNQNMLRAWIAAFRQAAQEHGIAGEPDLNAAFRVPGMLDDSGPVELGHDFEAALLAAASEALDMLNAARAREGADTVTVLRKHQAKIAESAAQMDALRADVTAQLQIRMQEKLAEVFRISNIDPARLAQEAALLTDRSDISEEIARLKIHTVRLAELFDQGGEAGKRLEFLAQEMQREANTILSKSMGAGEPGRRIGAIGLELKAEIEKIREQSLNLE